MENGLLFAQEPHILSLCACVRAFTSQSDAALAQEVELFSDLSPAAIMDRTETCWPSSCNKHAVWA